MAMGQDGYLWHICATFVSPYWVNKATALGRGCLLLHFKYTYGIFVGTKKMNV